LLACITIIGRNYKNYATNYFTSYLLNTSNLINNALASNMRVYNTALEQTRDNVKAFAKTNTNYIQAVKEHSVDSQNKEVNTNSP
jgi:abortive infection bacteriophage resistance protein